MHARLIAGTFTMGIATTIAALVAWNRAWAWAYRGVGR